MSVLFGSALNINLHQTKHPNTGGAGGVAASEEALKPLLDVLMHSSDGIITTGCIKMLKLKDLSFFTAVQLVNTFFFLLMLFIALYNKMTFLETYALRIR